MNALHRDRIDAPKPPSVAARACVFALAAAAAAAVAVPAASETIVNGFAALPGQVSTCQWFDDNLNDRSISSLTRQTDLLYNLVALPPGANVGITHTAATARGDQVVQFDLGGKTVCTSAQAFQTPAPQPSPTLQPSSTPTP